MYPFRSFWCCFDWVHWDVIIWAAAITFSLSTVIWAACQIDFTCVPVDVRVVLHKPGVSQDDCLMADTRDIEFGPALVTLYWTMRLIASVIFSISFGDLSALYSPIWTWEFIGPKLMHSDKLMVNKFTCCTTVYQCFHCQWTVDVDCVDLDGDIHRWTSKIFCFKGPLGFAFPFRIVYQPVWVVWILTQLPQSLVVHSSLTYLW